MCKTGSGAGKRSGAKSDRVRRRTLLPTLATYACARMPAPRRACWINRCTRQCYRCVQHLYVLPTIHHRSRSWHQCQAHACVMHDSHASHNSTAPHAALAEAQRHLHIRSGQCLHAMPCVYHAAHGPCECGGCKDISAERAAVPPPGALHHLRSSPGDWQSWKATVKLSTRVRG